MSSPSTPSPSRRDLLAAAAGLAVGLPTGMAAFAEEEAKPSMPTRELGGTGERVTLFGLGCFPLGGMTDEDAAIEVVLRALDRGCRYLDTAPSYARGKSETRVRGYLRPVSKPGVMEARPIIGLENPGLATVMVGVDTPYADHCRETSLEFIGTTDGSPPELRVEAGTVMVEGEEVEESRKLKDGDIIEIERVLYKYLRGNRR